MKLVKTFLKKSFMPPDASSDERFSQVEIFIVRLLVSPHHKDNLEPLGPQSPQRLAWV